jgi:hypothetical protein
VITLVCLVQPSQAMLKRLGSIPKLIREIHLATQRLQTELSTPAPPDFVFVRARLSRIHRIHNDMIRYLMVLLLTLLQVFEH